MREMLIICLLGPSGSGKSAIAHELKGKKIPALVSHRTRPIREKEEHGVDGYFVTKDKFQEYKEQNAFCAETEYKGNFYALSWGELNHFKSIGTEAVSYVVDSTGLDTLKKELEGNKDFRIVSVGLFTPKEMVLERLAKRGDGPEMVKSRISTYEKERSDVADRIDYLVGNVDGKLNFAVMDVMDIVEREKE